MAARKPLFMSADGFSDEMSPTADSMSLGGLTMAGDIAMGTNKVTGLGDGTVDTDAVNLGQLNQAVISGGTVKEVVLSAGQLDNTQGIMAAMLAFFANQPVRCRHHGELRCGGCRRRLSFVVCRVHYGV